MNDWDFKTLRHIETVRNFINLVIIELIKRQEQHDQSKLEDYEKETYGKYTGLLRNCKYNSEEYKGYLNDMKPALKHHYETYRHHPEHFKNGINDMNLVDLIEMICDWKSSTLRHNTGNIIESININETRFNISPQLKQILLNTAKWIEENNVYHKANES